MKNYTLQELLEELKNQTPRFEVGQFFEVIKSFYPCEEIQDGFKNMITENDQRATKPLACSSKSKKDFIKSNSPFKDFFKDSTRGDFLEIVETDGYNAVCINKSLKEDICEKHYSNDSMKFVKVSFEDVIVKNVKRVYRGINKYIKKDLTEE